jgi:hypothetical protein
VGAFRRYSHRILGACFFLGIPRQELLVAQAASAGADPKFLLVHIPFLLAVYWIETEWLKQKSNMPFWVTARGRKGSFYEWILIALICFIAWRQEHWMRLTIKSRLTQHDRGELEHF